MNLKKKIFYWSPFLVRIATPRAVINSAYSLIKFSEDYDCSIINFFGEFDKYQDDIKQKKIKLINYSKFRISKILPSEGKIQSRFSFLVMFCLGFFPLKKLISERKPDYIVIHLITSLPLILLMLFNFETKFILRISGLPKLNFFRKFIWKKALKKIYCVTCPTLKTQEYILNQNLVSKDKIELLYDPVINVGEIQKKINEKFSVPVQDDYYCAIGRLTKQKNFMFLCKAFKKVINKYPNIRLLIIGEGEQKKILTHYIKKNDLEKNIFLIGFFDNIFYILSRSKGFILSSLWEDPGFVIVEAAFCRVPIISSDCDNGPKELIKDSINGILFKSNNTENFLIKFDEFIKLEKNSNKLLLNNLKMSKKFTLFNHYLNFRKILNDL